MNAKKSRRVKSTPGERREAAWFYLMICPWLIGFFALTVYPMGASVYYSFTNWNMFQAPKWIGLQNYAKLLHNGTFITSLYNTFYYALIYVPLSMVIALFLAWLLNRNIRGKRFYRTLFYIPTLVPVVVSALIFMWILAPDGIMNKLLGALGIQGPAWFYDPEWSKPGLVIMSLWGLGSGFVLLLSGMQGIPQELYEAGYLDGTNAWQEFRHITMPMLSPMILYNLVMNIISALKIFTQPFVLGSQNGMPGRSGLGGGIDNSFLSMVQLLYNQAFKQYKMGYASAIAWVLFVIILLLTLLVMKSSEAWTYYEGESR